MRIALVTTSFFPQVGGAEFVVHNLALQWVKQGHTVSVFRGWPRNEPPATLDGYRVFSYPTPPTYCKLGPHRFPFGRYIAGGIKRALEAFQPEFISAHFGYPVGAWLSLISPVPRYLITCHGRELTRFSWGDRSQYRIDRVLARALNASAAAVAISSQARKLMEEVGTRPDKIIDIPNGVEIGRFRKKVGIDFRGRFGLPENAVIILSVGREHPQKAYDTGILAFAKIAAENPHLHYTIIGKGTERWRPLAKHLGVSDRLVLCEGLSGDDLVGAYQESDIFFSPSVWELMPLVTLEAMAAGLPLIATNISGNQDLIQNGENGFLVEPGQTDDMAEAIGKLATNPDLRKSLGAENLVKSENYSWERISRLYLEYH